MPLLKKLPESELEIMRVAWSLGGPVATPQISAAISGAKDWAPQTILTLLTRLEAKGFLTSEKRGKERYFTPAVSEGEYLLFESENFLETFHKNSLLGMMNALYDGKVIGEKDTDELRRWLDERK
ncbi:MAG: BlaI/MecI/CopY family transcriptional regulator [Defluviitaleaceae bacterium]|nr:BlaI/MecI/CopY family transcriptional regulator [Defluviitaleaceae bacterium]